MTFLIAGVYRYNEGIRVDSYHYRVFGTFYFIISAIIIFLTVFSGIYIYDRSHRKHRVEKIKEDSKNIVDYLKTDNSGITQLKLASVLQMDRKKIKKCLNHLEWLGVVEKKKVSAEETLFFFVKE